MGPIFIGLRYYIYFATFGFVLYCRLDIAPISFFGIFETADQFVNCHIDRRVFTGILERACLELEPIHIVVSPCAKALLRQTNHPRDEVFAVNLPAQA